jgi:8-oxo-dGTP pyrophosphatase MutT (NUDIX family)
MTTTPYEPANQDEFRPVEPRDAAAVILVRGDRVLWARRNPAIKFLGGFHAFPGGKTDDDDRRVTVANCVDPEVSAMLACAVREVFEEVGVLLARGGGRLTKGQRASLHDDLVSGRSRFREVLDHWGLWIDASDFVYTGHWTTPQFSPVRFKTRFFIAECPAKQEPYPAISELEKIEFTTPAAALERWRRSEVLISPPVLISLQGLVGFRHSPGEPIAQLGPLGDDLLRRSAECDGEIDHIELNPRTICIPLRTKTLPPAS